MKFSKVYHNEEGVIPDAVFDFDHGEPFFLYPI